MMCYTYLPMSRFVQLFYLVFLIANIFQIASVNCVVKEVENQRTATESALFGKKTPSFTNLKHALHLERFATQSSLVTSG